MNIHFDTHGNEKQKDCARAWVDPDISEIVYGGAKGGAKSFTGCSLVFADAFIYPGTHYFIARKELNDLRKFTIPSIHEVFGIWDIPQHYYNYNGQDNIFTLHNDSKVYLLHAKLEPRDPLYMRFGSMQMTRGWIEEAGEFEEDAKANLSASIGRWKNDVYNLPRKLLMTCNPAKNFLYNYYKDNKAGQLAKHVRFIQAFLQDNKMLPPGYIEHLKNTLKGAQYERLINGNWEYDDDPSVLIAYDKILDLFKNIHVKNELGTKYITCDVARMGSDKATIFVWRGFEVIELMEFDISKTTEIQAAIIALRIKHQIPASSIIVDEDGVGGGVVDNLSCKGFVNNSKALKNPKDHKQENYKNLKSQCYYRYAERVSSGGYYISCDLSTKQRETIIAEHEQIKSWNQEAEGKLMIIPKEEIKNTLGHSPDYTDGLMMREWFELKSKFPALLYA